jgi:hypothetical protein
MLSARKASLKERRRLPSWKGWRWRDENASLRGACNDSGWRVERRERKDLGGSVGMVCGRVDDAWCPLADVRKAGHPAQDDLTPIA